MMPTITLCPQAPFPVICAGSATHRGIWSYVEYTLEGDRLQGVVRAFDPVTHSFHDRESFEVVIGD